MNKKTYVLKGFEGWRHARQLQDELLDTLEAGLGADGQFGDPEGLLDDLLAGWLATGTPRPETTCPGRGQGDPWALTASRKHTCCYNHTANYKLHKLHYIGYNTASYQNCKNCKAANLQPGLLSLVAPRGPADLIIVKLLKLL